MKRDGFGSRLGALMALAGSAIGLGNLWKFPYMAGKNGGAAFILLYIGFMFLLCLPLMLSEFVIGRRSQANVMGAFRKLAPKTKWYFVGIAGTLTACIILSFYSVVGGWVIKYLFSSLCFEFSSSFQTVEQFRTFTHSSVSPVLMHFIFLGLVVAALWTGVKNGIERYSLILMPLLFVMILILAVYSLTLPNAKLGIDFLFKPDWSGITPGVALEALGQGLFSLSLGMGTVITYSSYIKKNENLGTMAIMTIIMDLFFALLAGIVILPAVFAFGFQPDEGPGLMFIILPEVFAKMPLGGVFAIIFFSSLFIAALTSAISLLEVIVAFLSEETRLSRKKTLLISGFVLAITGALCSLSMGSLSDITFWGNNIFDSFDKLSSIYLMPVGAFFISIFVGWKMQSADVYDELTSSGTVKFYFFKLFLFLAKYFVPLAIVVIFLNKLGVF